MVSTIERFHCIQDSQLGPNGVHYREVSLYSKVTLHHILWVTTISQIFVKLLRRYKYLQKVFEEEIRKMVNFLKGFSGDERRRLAIFTAVAILDGLTAKPNVLKVLTNEHLTRDGLSLQFVTEVFQVCTTLVLRGSTDLRLNVIDFQIERIQYICA